MPPSLSAAAAQPTLLPPRADFDGTPPQQLGLVPRAVRELFAVAAKDTTRRYTIRWVRQLGGREGGRLDAPPRPRDNAWPCTCVFGGGGAAVQGC